MTACATGTCEGTERVRHGELYQRPPLISVQRQTRTIEQQVVFHKELRVTVYKRNVPVKSPGSGVFLT